MAKVIAEYSGIPAAASRTFSDSRTSNRIIHGDPKVRIRQKSILIKAKPQKIRLWNYSVLQKQLTKGSLHVRTATISSGSFGRPVTWLASKEIFRHVKSSKEKRDRWFERRYIKNNLRLF